MTVRIFVSNLAIHGYHGLAAAERSLGQKFYVDIECKLKPGSAREDEMTTTVCYGELCDLAIRVSEKTTFNLIETLAHKILDEIFETYDLVEDVRVRIRKPSAPIRHIVDHVGIEVSRSRD